MLICLIGRHGTGKTTIGHALESQGIRHFSVGELKRMSRRRMFPKDVPARLMGMLSMQKPNTVLGNETANLLASFLKAIGNCSVDGFPASASHLDLLPEDTVIVYSMTPKLLREERLSHRQEKTGRRWAPDAMSARDSALSQLIRTARKRFRTICIRNEGKPIEDVIGPILALFKGFTNASHWQTPLRGLS